MGLDTIVVLVLALLFFGGIGFLAWHQRREQKSQVSEIPASGPEDTRTQAKQRQERK